MLGDNSTLLPLLEYLAQIKKNKRKAKEKGEKEKEIERKEKKSKEVQKDMPQDSHSNNTSSRHTSPPSTYKSINSHGLDSIEK